MLLPASLTISIVTLGAFLHIIPSDAGSGQDAPDQCQPNEAEIELEIGETYYGFFTFVDDASDHYGIRLEFPRTVHIEMQPSPALSEGPTPFQLPVPNYDLRLLSGTCAFITDSTEAGTQRESIEIFLEPGLYDIEVFVPAAGPVRHEAAASTMYCDPFCVLEGYGIYLPDLP